MRYTNYFYTHAIAHPFEQMIAIMCVICGGILEKFPNLKIAFLEAGIGWIPFWLERLDDHCETRANLVPGITKPPSEYIDSGNVYFFCESEEKMIPYLAEKYEDNIVFTSDYPHWDAKFPGAVASLAERDDLGEVVKRKILSDNAARFYGIDLD